MIWHRVNRVLCSVWIAVLLAFAISATAAAQVVIDRRTPDPTVWLGEAQGVPPVSVSAMKVEIGNWCVKPIYEIQNHRAHVIGLHAVAKVGTAAGSNFTSILYQRPSEPCDDWGAIVWEGSKPADVVMFLKNLYGIPDAQDPFWELTDTTTNGGGAAAVYQMGIAADDPLAELLGTLMPEDRVGTLAMLKDLGYAVADLPFEKSDQIHANAWLTNTSMFFDDTIGRNLQDQAFTSQVENRYGFVTVGPVDGVCELIRLVCDIYVCRQQRTCTPRTVYGEWSPAGSPCNCSTRGPWCAGCARVTADAEGKIKVNVPYPPPLGTTVELTVGVGVTLDVCVCAWQRSCTSEARRTVTTVNADCSTTTTVETESSMVFTAYDFQTAYPADQCQQAARPSRIPPDTQPCGLTNLTP